MNPKKIFAGVMPVLVTATLAAQAPQGPSPTQMVLKGKAPISNDFLKVKLPRPQTATLPNGLTIMVIEDSRLPQVSFPLIIPGAGGYSDPAARIGRAQDTDQMMREWTQTRNTLQRAQEM